MAFPFSDADDPFAEAVEQQQEAARQLEPPPVKPHEDPEVERWKREALAIGTKARQNQETQLRTSFGAAADTNPDKAADIYRIAARTGLSPATVANQYDALKKKLEQIDRPYQQIIGKAPNLAEWATDPTNAAIAKDDIYQLTTLEQGLDW